MPKQFTKTFAETSWSPEDITERFKATKLEAVEFLEENEKYIVEAMIQAGWDVIDSLSNFKSK